MPEGNKIKIEIVVDADAAPIDTVGILGLGDPLNFTVDAGPARGTLYFSGKVTRLEWVR